MTKLLINKEDKIFIAGHNGMVGQAINRAFIAKGYKNIVKVDKSTLDLRDQFKVNKWFDENRPSIIIIAAAKVGGIFANQSYPVEFLLDNLKIQNNLIECSWKYKSKRLLFLGSSCIYPKYSDQPIKEEYLMSSKLETTNESYAIAKITGIKLCDALKKQYNFDCFSLLPTNLYGPGDNYDLKNSHVIPALIKKFCDAKINKKDNVLCWGDGSPKREFLHVDDLAEACVFTLEKFNPGILKSSDDKEYNDLNYLNVGTGIEISIYDLAYKIADIVGYKGQIKWEINKPNGTQLKRLDITKLTSLGWKYSIDLEKGLKDTIGLYLSKYKNKNYDQ